MDQRESDARENLKETSRERREAKARESLGDLGWDEKEVKAQENLKKALQSRERPEQAETVTERRGPTQEEVDEANEQRREIKKVVEEFRKSGGSDEDLEKVLNRHFDALESEKSEPASPADDGRTLERGTRAVNLYTPEYRGSEIHSGDELRGVMKREVPGMLEHRDIDDMMKQADAHFKARERFKERDTVTAREIAEFAKEVGEPEPTVRAWVAKGAEPRVYSTMDSALTKEEAVARISKVREGLKGVDSFDELQKRLSHPHHEKTRKQVSFPKDLESSRKYFVFLGEMEKGGTIGDVTRRVGIGQPSGLRYLEGRKTRLVKRAMEPIPSHAVTESKERDRIDSPKKYREALDRHPFVKEHPDFKKLDHEAMVYTKFTDLKKRGELPDKLVKDLAEEHKVSKQQLASWLSERKTQELVRNLEIYDKARATHESKLKPEAFEHRIDPSKVYEHFRYLREVKDPSADQLAEAIENMYRKSELTSGVQWGELRPYHGGGPKWLREIAQSIHDHRADVEGALNRRLGLDTDPDARMRLGVLDSKLYLRKEDTSQWNWMNIYKNEVVHFKALDQKNQLVDEAKA
ncbi:MAG: hypothetical protein ACFFER_18520, partial [Candidatus Thorarchaeota archaeon]